MIFCDACMPQKPVTSDVPLGTPKEESQIKDAWLKEITTYGEAEEKYRKGELTAKDVENVLSLTVKGERDGKTATILFDYMLLNFTDDSQQNILMKAESAAGKTYLVKEVASLFPPKRVDGMHAFRILVRAL